MFSPFVGYLSSCFHFETKLSIFKKYPNLLVLSIFFKKNISYYVCNSKLCFFSKRWLDVSVPNHIHIPASLFFIDFYFIQLMILFQIS
jgi:hypothetical protein